MVEVALVGVDLTSVGVFVGAAAGTGCAVAVEGSSTLAGFDADLVFSAADFSGRANCEDMIAGSTGVPLTVDCAAGARLAGGIYLLLDEDKGGKSCLLCLRTPLYLVEC